MNNFVETFFAFLNNNFLLLLFFSLSPPDLFILYEVYNSDFYCIIRKLYNIIIPRIYCNTTSIQKKSSTTWWVVVVKKKKKEEGVISTFVVNRKNEWPVFVVVYQPCRLQPNEN